MRIRVARVNLDLVEDDGQNNRRISSLFKQAASRRYAFLAGVETGLGAGYMSEELMQAARAHGYSLQIDAVDGENLRSWVALRKDLVLHEYVVGFEQVDGFSGVNHLVFDTTHPNLGTIAIGQAYLLVEEDSKTESLNRRVLDRLSVWARAQNNTDALSFIVGDDLKLKNRENRLVRVDSQWVDDVFEATMTVKPTAN